MEEPSPGELEQAIVEVRAEFDCQVKQIVAERDIHLPSNRRHKEYLLHWKGLPESAVGSRQSL